MEPGKAGGETPPDDDARDDPAAEEASEWFARLRNAAPDAETQARFEAWLAADPRHREEYRTLERLWDSPEFQAAAAGVTTPLARRRKPNPWPTRIAALAAAALLAIGVHQFPGWRAQWLADVATATGEVETFALPDGSSMTLNTGSAVALDFEGGRREVALLAGEAFFDVRHDAAHPFRVTGGFGTVTVLGTAFAVRAETAKDSVVLERGRVEVALLSDPSRHVALAPSQTVSAEEARLSEVASADPSRALAWRDGRVVFSGAPLARVLDELDRYYGGAILLADSGVGALAISGNYRIDDIEAAVQTLAEVAGVSLARLPGGVLLLY